MFDVFLDSWLPFWLEQMTEPLLSGCDSQEKLHMCAVNKDNLTHLLHSRAVWKWDV